MVGAEFNGSLSESFIKSITNTRTTLSKSIQGKDENEACSKHGDELTFASMPWAMLFWEDLNEYEGQLRGTVRRVMVSLRRGVLATLPRHKNFSKYTMIYNKFVIIVYPFFCSVSFCEYRIEMAGKKGSVTFYSKRAPRNDTRNASLLEICFFLRFRRGK